MHGNWKKSRCYKIEAFGGFMLVGRILNSFGEILDFESLEL